MHYFYTSYFKLAQLQLFILCTFQTTTIKKCKYEPACQQLNCIFIQAQCIIKSVPQHQIKAGYVSAHYYNTKQLQLQHIYRGFKNLAQSPCRAFIQYYNSCDLCIATPCSQLLHLSYSVVASIIMRFSMCILYVVTTQ